MTDQNVESSKKPLLSARQVGMAAAFGGAALALVLAGVTIPIPGTPVVTDPREIFTTIGASLTGPVGGVVVGLLAGIAEPGIPFASLLAHVVGGVFNGLVYKNFSWRLKEKKALSLAAWALQVFAYYTCVVIPALCSGFDGLLSRSGIRRVLRLPRRARSRCSPGSNAYNRSNHDHHGSAARKVPPPIVVS